MKPELIALLEQELNVTFHRAIQSEPRSMPLYYYAHGKEVLVELCINNQNLREIPKAFYQCPKDLATIRNLSLRSNQITEIGTCLELMPELIRIDLRNNKIADVSLFRQTYSNLQSVHVDDNQIFDLTPFYRNSNYNKFREMTFANNPLVYPAADVKSYSEFIKILDGKIKVIKAIIARNFSEKTSKLDLGNLGITDLAMFPELLNCSHLKTLILSNEWSQWDDKKKQWKLVFSKNQGQPNNLYYIPEEIKRLSGLEVLIAGGDWKSSTQKDYRSWRLKEITGMFKLRNLCYLNLSNNQIIDISSLNELQQLKTVSLNNNQITDVPDLSTMPLLKEVYLSNNRLNDIQFLINAVQLETVDLHSNQIKNLVPLVPLLENSKTGISVKATGWEKGVIAVNGNSSQLVPPETVLTGSNRDFFLYLRQLKYEDTLKLPKYFNKEIKIVLVGNSSAGKSTLLHYLKTGEYRENLPVTYWMVTQEIKDFSIENERFKLRFFDFGGHDYYHDTHKMFFSNESVFLLLWEQDSNHLGEVSDERDQQSAPLQVFPLKYWLDAIKIYAQKSKPETLRQIEELLDERDSKVNVQVKDTLNGNWTDTVISTTSGIEKLLDERNILIVQNKIDKGAAYLNQAKLVKKNSGIYGFGNISLKLGTGIDSFKGHYNQLLRKNPNYNRPLLASWGIIKDNLLDVFKKDNFIISFSVFRKKINEYLVNKLKTDYGKSEREVQNILFSEEDTSLFARSLKEVGLVIFNTDKSGPRDSIIVNQDKFLSAVHEIVYVAGKNQGRFRVADIEDLTNREMVVKILIEHKVLFVEKSTGDYIAPLFLPDKPDFLVDLLSDLKTPFRRFRFKGFIPKGIILSIFSEVVYQQDIAKEDFYYWKNGLIFKDAKTGQKVMLKFDIGYEHGCAFIDLFNFKSNHEDSYIKSFLKIITRVIKAEGLKVDEMLTLDGKYFVKMKRLEFCYENRISFTVAKDFVSQAKKQVNVYGYNKLLEDSMKTPSKKLFISYSKQDEKLVNNFLDHLSALKSTGLVESWYCTELKPGQDWDVVIKEKLYQADIVCFMLSSKFMSTPYILKYEVKHAFKRYQAGEHVKIVPILLDYVDWNRSFNFQTESGEDLAWKLNKFVALPFALNPVKAYKNENKAWYLVTTAIRGIIDNNVDTADRDEDEVVRSFAPDIRKIIEDVIDGKGLK